MTTMAPPRCHVKFALTLSSLCLPSPTQGVTAFASPSLPFPYSVTTTTALLMLKLVQLLQSVCCPQASPPQGNRKSKVWGAAPHVCPAASTGSPRLLGNADGVPSHSCCISTEAISDPYITAESLACPQLSTLNLSMSYLSRCLSK